MVAVAAVGGRGGGGGFGGGGFGGFGGGGFGGVAGGANAARNSASTSSQYNNNGAVGTAQISVDPDTHNLIIIADAPTMAQIRSVLANLDAPKPQVLIKVVFMEVEHNDSSEIGVQGQLHRPDQGFFSDQRLYDQLLVNQWRHDEQCLCSHRY